jgi:Na+-transporting NADH:ubiquinone oxidoreductase subunit NqrE
MKKHSFLKKKSFGNAVLFGIIAAIVSFILLSLLSSALILLLNDPSSWIIPMFLPVFLLSAAIFGYAGTKINREYGIYPTLLASVCCICALILASVIVGGGKMGVSNLLSYLCYILVAVLFSFFGKIPKKRKHVKR